MHRSTKRHNNCHRNYTNGIFLQIHIFGDFYASGTQDAEVAKSPLVLISKIWLDIYYNNNNVTAKITLISAYFIL